MPMNFSPLFWAISSEGTLRKAELQLAGQHARDDRGAAALGRQLDVEILLGEEALGLAQIDRRAVGDRDHRDRNLVGGPARRHRRRSAAAPVAASVVRQVLLVIGIGPPVDRVVGSFPNRLAVLVE